MRRHASLVMAVIQGYRLELLGMPVGSIGPTLGRCLHRLRNTNAMRAYLAATLTGEGQRGGDRLEFARMDR